MEKKILGEFGCQKFIYCSDSGLGSEDIRVYNHMGARSYIVTQSIKKLKKNRKNPNDPAHFIGTTAATQKGETADIHHYLGESKIEEESRYDRLYAVCTDLLDDEVSDILKVSEGGWQIEECFLVI